ncbi:10574_t:CDS:2, partial [Acaulospora morrowiae]
MSERKCYALYLFFTSGRDVILRSYEEYYQYDFDLPLIRMWDTVYGYPYIYEDDKDAVVRLTKDQFDIELNLQEIEHLFDDVMNNKFYICNTRKFNADGIRYQRITSQNHLEFEDNVDFYVHSALGGEIFKRLNKREMEKHNRKLRRMGIDRSLILDDKNRCFKHQDEVHPSGPFHRSRKEFENKIYSILNKDSRFKVNLTRSVQGDGGVDLILFYQDMVVFIQCKNLASKVGVNHVKEFITTLETNKNDKKLGLLISTNGFTKPCYDYELENHDLILLAENDNISRCIISHYQRYNLYDKKKDPRSNMNIVKLDVNMEDTNLRMSDFNELNDYSSKMMNNLQKIEDDIKVLRSSRERSNAMLCAYLLIANSNYSGIEQ